MAVISFRTPQEGIEQYQKAVDLMALVYEIAHSPTIGKVIDDLSKQLLIIHDISEAKKKELFAAEETIAQAGEIDQEHTARELAIKKTSKEVELSQKYLQNDLEAFAVEKLAVQEAARKVKLAAEEKLSQAAAQLAKAELLNGEIESATAQLADKKAEYKEIVARFKEAQDAADLEFNARVAQHEADMQALADDRAAFELRKKRVDDALKES